MELRHRSLRGKYRLMVREDRAENAGEPQRAWHLDPSQGERIDKALLPHDINQGDLTGADRS
jgi:hypothetical protein